MGTAFGPSALSGIHVLVAEDNDDLRELLGELLSVCGADVTTVASGNEGWRSFEANRPDLLISDIQMPDGSGYELIGPIRALSFEDGGLTPAIAVSATSGPEQSLAAGFHAHVAKPLDPLVLIDLVRSFVKEGAPAHTTWALTSSDPAVALLTFAGRPTADEMRTATRALVIILEASPRHVVVDLRQVSGFDLSVGSVAERVTWNVRHRIGGATIVGGSLLARLVAKAACVALGISVSFVESWPA